MAMSIVVHIPYMGVGFFFMLNTLAFINYKLMNGLHKIDKNVNSYLYLKTFDKWMKQMILLNQRFSRLLYPLAFLSVVIGFWFGGFGGDNTFVKTSFKTTGHANLLDGCNAGNHFIIGYFWRTNL